MRTTLASLTVLILILCPFSAVRTRSSAQAAQSPDLAEAELLTREIVQLYKAGKFDEALPKAERALALREKALGPDSAEVGRSLSNLATILMQLEKYDRALDAYQRALTILESKLGPDDPLTNQTREDLANVYYKKGDYKKAQALFEAALASREKSLGPEHELVTRTLVDLAYVYMSLGDRPKRDATFRRLLDQAEKRPEQTLKVASKAFSDYACTGATHPLASEEQKEIEKRIQQLWHAPKLADGGGALSGGVLNGKALSRPQPEYPIMARSARVQGTVIVRVSVDETGKVIDAEAICGPRELYGASVAAAKQWKFTPTLLSGVPVKVTGTISFNFMLR